jgi:hypothetical protein
MTQVQLVESERKRQADELKAENEKLKTLAAIKDSNNRTESQVAKNMAQAHADADRIEQMRTEGMLDAKVELWKNREDNATKLQIEAAKLMQSSLSTDVPELPEPEGF